MDVLRNRDVEHYRPKTQAVGQDGEMRVGYWWLAWTWENLFFSCDGCNRFEKNDLFPLRDEHRRLQAKQAPPGPERPLLLDPASPQDDPMDHLVYRPVADPGDWWVFPRHGSVLGQWTIQVLGLNRDELRTLYRQRFEVDLRPGIREKQEELAAAREDPVEKLPAFREKWRRYICSMNAPTQRFAGLVHDIHDHHFPPTLRRMLGLDWRRP